MNLFSSTKPKFPRQIRFNTELARRVVPQRLVDRGFVADLEEGKRALELVISMAETEDETKISKKSD